LRLKKGKKWADLIGKVGTAEEGLKIFEKIVDRMIICLNV